MNNNGISRRPPGPVRQHSLQQPPRRQQQIRRQRSSEDEKTLQVYSSTVASRSRFASNKCDLYNNQVSVHDRPKVRVAWADQPSKSKSDSVEIVARQIPTGKSSRPTTGRGSRRCPLAEKATFLYSRQELAERLRLAWRQREENKTNIDIFLAHNTMEERSESRLSTMTNRTVITPKIQVKNEEVEDVIHVRDDSEVVDENEKDTTVINESMISEVVDEKEKDTTVIQIVEYQHWFSSSESNESAIKIAEDSATDSVENSVEDSVEDSVKDEDNVIEDENKENIASSLTENKDDVIVVEKKPCISINCTDWNAPLTINNKPADNNDNGSIGTTTPIKEPDYSQAKLKRAGFQSGLNKAFNTPITEKSPSTSRINSRVSTPQQEPARTSFRRTNSAPPQRRTQVNIVIDTPGITSTQAPLIEPERPARAMSANERKSRTVKSAPSVKRRLKMSKRRGLSVAYSKDGEDDVADGKRKSKSKGSKNAMMESKGNTGDVITMVSLISSADSESEMDDNLLRDDKLISELRSKLPTTPIIKSSNGFSTGIRKPFKSVSFQQDSFDYESPPPSHDDSRATSNNLQARFIALSKAVTSSTDDNSTPLIAAMTSWKMESVQYAPMIMSLQQQQEAPTTEAPLTDREKRCLAVPIGDVLDKKRKLVRCRSAVVTTRDTNHEKRSSDTSRTCLQTEMRLSQIASQIAANLQENVSSKTIVNSTIPVVEVSEEKAKPMPCEPYCQTPKEKECWHLYKKMCDKGVFVSFDTVLRGMLTPTEYRLRQKEVSQNC
ncbi:uncharacterized protein LOC131669029 [Phymastichus coffea]|uniref:uncharacterized protein LOC131669029 n=1 Tax=Phymastichus coffea TaxID=108790 RepID=UPI00273B6D6D|nr:uncharacterized protein LOC131669029 [Phymastichus coffea]